MIGSGFRQVGRSRLTRELRRVRVGPLDCKSWRRQKIVGVPYAKGELES